jgi:crotonobetainyl-CoA:carnitine CoA-transferase CaiB-like acyl-CoA transferase/alkylation response protein AidB-like acyl-CoA dehydrogenase
LTSASSAGAGPYLDGVRILDLTTALAGPYCTAILSDLGAEVWSIEPIEGDSMRRRGRPDGLSIPFEMVHRDKRSIPLDIRNEAGQSVVAKLSTQVDAVVENFRPGVLDRHGLGPSDLLARSPALVYCSISGFGHTGPRRRDGVVDLVAQGYAGLMSVTGTGPGEMVKAGYPVADLGAGMWGAIGVLAGLRRRDATGVGGHLDISMVDGLVSWGMWELADYQVTGEVPEPIGTAHRLTAPYQAFRCRDDRWLTVAAVDRLWVPFCRMMGLEVLQADPRFSTESARYTHRSALGGELAAVFVRSDRDEWLARLDGAGIPAGPINTIPDLLCDEQLSARGLFVEIESEGRRATLVNTPIVGDGSPRIRGAAPQLGADTMSVLRGAGYADDAIRGLTDAGVIGVGHADLPAQPSDGGGGVRRGDFGSWERVPMTGVGPDAVGKGFLDVEQCRFHERFTAWLETSPAPTGDWDTPDAVRRHLDWQRVAADAGYGAIHWPIEFGGRAATLGSQLLVLEELARRGHDQTLLAPALNFIGPLLMEFGTDQQRAAHLEAIRTGQQIWCQLFSEPDSGSDLPSLRTAADRVGDDFVVTGQKIWSSMAQHAHFGLLLCRTERGSRGRDGLSLLIIDMSSPGIEVRPIPEMDGSQHLNEVFFTDARVPIQGLIGPLGQGWPLVRRVVGTARASFALHEYAARFGMFVRYQNSGSPLHPEVRDRLVDVWARLAVQRLILLQSGHRGGLSYQAASVGKLRMSGTAQALALLSHASVGMRGMAWEPHDRQAEEAAVGLLAGPKYSIAGGTDQIQRNTIAEQLLGLPR